LEGRVDLREARGVVCEELQGVLRDWEEIDWIRDVILGCDDWSLEDQHSHNDKHSQCWLDPLKTFPPTLNAAGRSQASAMSRSTIARSCPTKGPLLDLFARDMMCNTFFIVGMC
jgi:hypothetical protein